MSATQWVRLGQLRALTSSTTIAAVDAAIRCGREVVVRRLKNGALELLAHVPSSQEES